MKAYRKEEGAAAVEVAILSLVMVPIVLYSIFFFDLALMGLRALEAARYAAWEFTRVDASEGISSLDKTIIQTEIEARWGDDMNSATSSDSSFNRHPGIFNEKITGLTVTELDSSYGGNSSSAKISITERSPYLTNAAAEPQSENKPDGDISEAGNGVSLLQDIVNKFSSVVNKGASWVYGTWLQMNVQGYVEIDFSTKLKFNRSAPIYKGESLMIGDMPVISGKQKLLIDAWDLKDGRDADYLQGKALSGDGGAGEKYYNQVNKLVFGGIKGQLDALLGGVGDVIKNILNALDIRNPFEPAVRSYALTGVSGSSCKNAESCVEFGDGRVNPLGNAEQKFYTNVFKDTYNKNDSPYYNVYKRNGKGYYMGCDKPQIDDRQDCWQN